MRIAGSNDHHQQDDHDGGDDHDGVFKKNMILVMILRIATERSESSDNWCNFL